MIREVANLTIIDGSEVAFLAAVEQAVPLFKAAKGCTAMRLEKVIETPNLYRLIVLWETLDDHNVTFRNSEDFQKWRALAGPYFSKAPDVDHSEIIVAGFD
ncbi:MAG: antibiotic biosynthesis monooxygenase [Rhodobacteraceae bacterium]|nr:antibiotic biosynthesis monooxygenase [Paracoccaceae bacterium]PHR55894.1 MAG: antibiotic biosynthesis monooxygenase [Robiginitomaculum sp.]